MCEYSSVDGHANDWHLVHLGSRAVGGAGVVFTEATAVSPEGRISPQDLGIWSDAHIEFLSRIAGFVHSQGSIAGIQLAHAGRKGSTYRPSDGTAAIPESEGGWRPVAPSPLAFSEGYALPEELTEDGIRGVVRNFAEAARRSREAGFRLIEIHSAHGYLLHEFLSPLSNQRTGRYGGSYDNRVRFLLEVVTEVRKVWPDQWPVFVRLSSTDWVEGGWNPDDTVELARRLARVGVDLVDCSSGGLSPAQRIPIGPGYQTEFAERVRKEAGVASGAVGMITSPEQADHILRTGQTDMVLLAREMLRDPYWPLHAARELGHAASWPVQYLRAAPKDAPPRSPMSF